MNWISEKMGKLLADYLNEPSGKYETWSTAHRAICSMLIAQVFQLVAYPILPLIKPETVAGNHYRRI